ncbi:hypothetical protein O181_029888 [Austropuccinia psidii MF-1]|uniref:RNase H type-1 domain-containing protein n=1 Tax=Austropuccinia psidii MF-1 TaxID=1389203 RepID=A0A9Q3CUF4_9BASI|nr:hypothetical protein [Austropuccinia psidii MF-1]
MNNPRHNPTIIAMDSNLHSNLWNPRGYNHVHPQAKDLIRICGSKGFKLCSPRGTPTFIRSTNIATTIDLLWANLTAIQLIEKSNVVTNNHSSDHQPIKTFLNLKGKTLEIKEPHRTMKLTNLKRDTFTQDIQKGLLGELASNTQQTKEKVDEDAEWVSSILKEAYFKQGKWVRMNTYKTKAWWDKSLLNPIVKERNRARRWMLLTRSMEAITCYQQWQQIFRTKVEELKRKHWRAFLADNGPNHAFDAFRFTKTVASGEVHPLRNIEGKLTNDKQEQTDLFFRMFAQAGTTVEDAEDTAIATDNNRPHRFEKITIDEIRTNIKQLPNKKSPGPDGIPNELIKIACEFIVNKLADLFNNCLTIGHFPTPWKKASTIIIQKTNKNDYSDPSAYRPIALLNTLSKLFERILNNRIMYWAHKTGAIAENHFGGRRGRNIEEAMILLDSWIKERWREGKVVAGLFLDVKSAYPAVHREKLVQILTQKQAPDYITAIIRSFLQFRYTELRLDDYKSQMRPLERGLPQGSPLSVTLYLLYNSELLDINSDPAEPNRLSIGYVDDITHLLAADTAPEATVGIEDLGRRTIEWGRKMGSEFDKKKTKFMLFNNPEGEQRQVKFGEEQLRPSSDTRWLGINLDSKLTYANHIKTIKSRADVTLAQINRICKKYFGISMKDTRTLIKAVLYTRILFGSILWLTTPTLTKIKPILEITYNKAARMVLGSLKSTPIIFLKRDSELKSVLATHIVRVHNFLLRLATKEEAHPTKVRTLRELREEPTSHPSSIHKLIRREKITNNISPEPELINLFPTKPWRKILPIRNIGATKEEAEKSVRQLVRNRTPQEVLVFTDGSDIPGIGKGAAAVAIPSDSTSTRHITNDTLATNFETELVGIKLAIELIRREIYARRDKGEQMGGVHILCDNQAALRKVADPTKPSTGQHLYLPTSNEMISLSNLVPIHLTWCPGHTGIEGNEKADSEAKKAASNPSTQRQPIPPSKAKIKQRILNENKPAHFTPEERKRLRVRSCPRKFNKALNSQEKAVTSTINQLRSEHVVLNKYLHRIGVRGDPLCDVCNQIESVRHFLSHCRRYKTQRKKMKTDLRHDRIRFNSDDMRGILDIPRAIAHITKFILDSNRFEHLQLYRKQKS